MEYGILFLLIFVVVLYFQSLFSASKNKYVGLILPVLSAAASLIWVIYMVAVNGEDIGKALFTLVFVNVPTYIMLAIYFHQKKPPKPKKIKPRKKNEE